MKGLSGIAFFLEPLEAQVRDDIGSVSHMFYLFAVLLHAGVVIGTLTIEDFISIESCGIGFQVPLSDQGGAVTGFSEEFGEGDLRTIEDVPIGHLSVVEGMPARENDRPGRGANGIGDIAALEGHSLICDAVEVRGLYQFRSIGTDGMGA